MRQHMKIEFKLILIGSVAIILLDSAAASLARKFNFSYASFWPASILVYFLVTYQAAKYWGIKGAVTFGAYIGLFDATIGWKISTWIPGDIKGSMTNLTFGVWFTTVFIVMLLGILISLPAFFIASYREKRRRS
jgi:hypothetical protein